MSIRAIAVCPCGGGDHQRRHPGRVALVDVGAAGDQRLHDARRGRTGRRRQATEPASWMPASAASGQRDAKEAGQHCGGRTIAYGTVSRLPHSGMNVDHRFTQTQKQYAADDLETMSEAVRYQAHVFGLVRPASRRSRAGGRVRHRHDEPPDPRHQRTPAAGLHRAQRELRLARRRRAPRPGARQRSGMCHLEECDRGELRAAAVRHDRLRQRPRAHRGRRPGAGAVPRGRGRHRRHRC